MAAAIDQDESPLDQLVSDLLRYETFDTIVVNMTVESSRRKSDWRGLASVLGFSERQVQLMQQDTTQRCKGRLLIGVWEDLGKTSLRKFVYALKEAHMGECLRALMQDPDLEELGVDFSAVLKEYEQLKESKLLRKQLPRVPMSRFREVFYPHVKMENTPSTCHPGLPEGDLVETEHKTNSSCPTNAHHTSVQQELDENSVFISYCPESGIANRKFNNQLRRFAEFIQNQGFTLYFEPNSQAEIRSYGSPVTWKEVCIKRSKNIVVVCTPEYYKEDCKTTDNSRRRSVSKIEVDSRLLRQLAYSQESSRIIPVVLDARKPTRNQIPLWLMPMVTHTWPSGQVDLDLCLRGLPRYVLPKVDPSKKKVIKPIVIDFPDARRHKC